MLFAQLKIGHLFISGSRRVRYTKSAVEMLNPIECRENVVIHFRRKTADLGLYIIVAIATCALSHRRLFVVICCLFQIVGRSLRCQFCVRFKGDTDDDDLSFYNE